MAKKKFRKTNKKKIIWSIVAVLLCAAVGVGIYFAIAYKDEIKEKFDDLKDKDKDEQIQDDTQEPATEEEALALQLID